MVRPVVTCGTDITYTWNQGGGSMTASLAATATNSPTSWEWTILSVPAGLEYLLVGTYGDFTNAIALVQNPFLPVPTDVAAGSIVVQCRAANGPSPSDKSSPVVDQAGGQQVIGIQDINGRLYPGDFEYDWGQRVLDAVLRASPISHQASHVDGLDQIPTATTGARGLLPVLGGGTTDFLRADGSWAEPPVPPMVDPNAIHVDVASEIRNISEKISPTVTDRLVIEDSADGYAKKSVQIGNLPGGSGGGGNNMIAMAINENTDSSSSVIVGALGLLDTFFTGLTTKFAVTAYVTGGGLTGTVELYNLTDSASVTSLTFTELISTRKTSASFSLAVGTKVYEIRIKVSGGGSSSDRIVCMWAGVEASIP